jgi:hypothetical protein
MLESMDESATVLSIVSQYRASLAMVKHVVHACPEDFWLSTGYRNRFWHIAYHALFFAHLYVQASAADFKPWTGHKPDSQFLGPPPWAPNEPFVLPAPYSKGEVMEYHDFCCQEVAAKVSAIRLDADSGFDWLPFDRFEAHLYNIRHIQHHTGQLADRLRTALNIATPWVPKG